MEKLSVVIITFNEQAHIARCIESVRAVADEIVVLDSYSTDNTVAIATGLGAVVYQQKFLGYVNQKNKALQLATYDYVLSLDADEALDETLQQSIAKAKQEFVFHAYKMNRCAFYCGAFIRHGAWYPEPKVRLINRKQLQWGGYDPHDRIEVPETTAVYPLKGDILHYICNSVEQHRQRTNRFSTIAAESLFKAGKRTNLLKVIASPAWFFINDFLIRRGFLSGVRGWNITRLQTLYHFQKYLKLWKLWKVQPRREQRWTVIEGRAGTTEFRTPSTELRRSSVTEP